MIAFIAVIFTLSFLLVLGCCKSAARPMPKNPFQKL
jgi:hypothetical protein